MKRREVISAAAITTGLLAGCSGSAVEAKVDSSGAEQDIIRELESGVVVFPGAFEVDTPSGEPNIMVRPYVKVDGSFGCDPATWQWNGERQQLGGMYALGLDGEVYSTSEWPIDPEFRSVLGKKTLNCVQFDPDVDDYSEGEVPQKANFDGQWLNIGRVASTGQDPSGILEPLN